MVIHNFDFCRAFVRPAKAYPKLIVNANAVLTLTAPFEGFQPVSRRDAEIIKLHRGV